MLLTMIQIFARLLKREFTEHFVKRLLMGRDVTKVVHLGKTTTMMVKCLLAVSMHVFAEQKPAHSDQITLLPVRIDEKWGYIDLTGKVVIQPQYQSAGMFLENLAAVEKDDKAGFIDMTGKVVIPFQYRRANAFINGIANVRNEKHAHLYIDKSGKVLYEAPLGEMLLGGFNDGLAPATSKGKVGFVDTSGKFVIPAKFDVASGFEQGFAPAKLGEKVGIIDKQGTFVVEPKFEYIGTFVQGSAVAMVNGKHGFIDTKGQWIIQPAFDGAYGFSDGLAPVRVFRKWGYVDASGKTVIEPQFMDVGSFREGVATARTRTAWGLIDKTGHWIIDPQYVYIEPTHHGSVFIAADDQKRGYITREGKWIWSTPVLK